MEFSANLRRLRKAAGFTQEALAEKLHLTGQAVSRWETGDGYPEITLLPTLADLLGVTVDALLRNAELTGEEIYAIEGEALRLTQEGKREEAIALLETQLMLHPEAELLRERMARYLLQNARFLLHEGKNAQAELNLRKAQAAAEELRSSRDPWLRQQPETMLPEIYYRLGEKEKLRQLHGMTVDPYYSSMYNCAVGKDFYYVFERGVLDAVIQLNSIMEGLAFRMPKGRPSLRHAGPDEPGQPLLYEPYPGEEEWNVSDGERFEIMRSQIELLEMFSGGEGFGVFRDQETSVFTKMLTLAADMGAEGKLLDTLELYVERFASRELAEWERKRVLALDSYRMALEGLMRKGMDRDRAETEAIARLSPREKELMTEPVSPLPALQHLQLFRVFWRDPPLLPFRMQELRELLTEPPFDFVRQEARFRAAQKTVDTLVRELELAGQLPPKNLEARRGIK